MDRPPNIALPFFSYGIFRPGQLGFLRLKDLVNGPAQPARVRGSLLLRDGLPIVDEHGTSTVEGTLLHFDPARAEQAYDRVAALEPDNHYRWGLTLADGTVANVLFGRSPRKGSVPCHDDEWDCWADPLFTAALEVVAETLESEQEFEWNLKPLFKLQMAYLLLWSSIERYVSLRYHLADRVMEKVGHLAEEPAFAEGVRMHVQEPREVYRADRPNQRVALDPTRPDQALSYYYQIRSNITHRGKAVVKDHDRVLMSLRELLAIFDGVLKAAKEDARPGDRTSLRTLLRGE